MKRMYSIEMYTTSDTLDEFFDDNALIIEDKDLILSKMENDEKCLSLEFVNYNMLTDNIDNYDFSESTKEAIFSIFDLVFKWDVSKNVYIEKSFFINKIFKFLVDRDKVLKLVEDSLHIEFYIKQNIINIVFETINYEDVSYPKI